MIDVVIEAIVAAHLALKPEGTRCWYCDEVDCRSCDIAAAGYEDEDSE